MTLSAIPITKPEDVNVIVGQSHFVKTVEDLHECLAAAGAGVRFGVAFCEASGPRLVRRSGNDPDLVALAVRNALAVSAGHCFFILMKGAFPVSVLNAVKAVPEVCVVHCATQNPLQVIVVETELGRGIVGVVDGAPPTGEEGAREEAERKGLLRRLGYKL